MEVVKWLDFEGICDVESSDMFQVCNRYSVKVQKNGDFETEEEKI